MGLPITSINDYKAGGYSLPLNDVTKKDLITDLNRYERKYLCDLLGYEVFNLFIADLDTGTNIPTEQRFTDIFNELNVSSECHGGKFISFGIKEMLKGFVSFEYIRAIEFPSTMA